MDSGTISSSNKEENSELPALRPLDVSSSSDDKSNSTINSKENDDEYQSVYDANSTVILSEAAPSQRSSVNGNPREVKEESDSTERDELVRKAALFDLINNADTATKAVLLELIKSKQNQVISTTVEDTLVKSYDHQVSKDNCGNKPF